MKSLLFFALIFAAPAFASSIGECRKASNKMPKSCDGVAKEAVSQSNLMSGNVGLSCRPSEKTGQFDIKGCSQQNGQVNDATKRLLSTAAAECDKFKDKCNSTCNNLNAEDKKKHQAEANQLKKECVKKIEATKKNLTDGANANAGASDGSGKTADGSTGNGQMPMMMPPTQQSSDDDDKTDATQTQATTPQQTSTTTPAEEQKPQEETKNGTAGFEEAQQPQSAEAACSGGKFMCPGCPGFAQKCGSGDASACISKMSSSDQNIISSNCGGSSGGTTAAQALTNPTTAQSMTGMSLGAGSSGGTTGTVSGGMDTQAMLNDGKKNDTEPHQGRKEGGSLGTESGGGGGSGSSDSYGGSGGDLFGDSGSAMNALNKAIPRSLASAFQGGSASSTDSKVVVDRYGPNLFSILGETIKGRCDRNLLLHCPNRK